MSLFDCYKVLGVSVGASLTDISSSYKRLCRIHHPDVSDDPGSAELMKEINIAYSTLREKFRRETAFRDRQTHQRYARRYAGQEPRASQDSRAAGAGSRRTGEGARAAGESARTAYAESYKDAYNVLYDYFIALCACDYSAAYDLVCGYDKQQTTADSFIEWRDSVARLYHMKEFFITAASVGTVVQLNDGKTILARKFHVVVNEDDLVENTARSTDVEKLMISEQGVWKVFLGYKGVGELTRAFDEKYEAERRRDIAKRWEEYVSEQYPDFNMFSLNGMRKAASSELYRQSRFGGTLTFAVVSVKSDGKGNTRDSRDGAGSPGNGANSGGGKADGDRSGTKRNESSTQANGRRDQLLRSAARTICGAMRETDIPAYAGDGVFMILFVELRKKDAEEIIVRLTKKIRGNAGTRLGLEADIDYAYRSWSGSGSASIDAFNEVLKKFDKTL